MKEILPEDERKIKTKLFVDAVNLFGERNINKIRKAYEDAGADDSIYSLTDYEFMARFIDFEPESWVFPGE